jgi:hypothetical protein
MECIMDSWYIRTRNGELGPFTAPEIQFLIRTGAASHNDYVRSGDTSLWMPLQDSPLADQASAATVADVSQDQVSVAAPETVKSMAPSDKVPQPAIPAGQRSQPSPRSWSQGRTFNPQYGVAAAAVAVLLLAILALLRMVTLTSAVPPRQSAAETATDTDNAQQSPSNSEPPAADGQTDPRQQHPEEPVASAAPAPQEQDGPAETPKAATPPATPDSSDQIAHEPVAPEQKFQTGLPAVRRNDSSDGKPRPRRDVAPALQSSDLRGRSAAGRAAAIASSGGDEDSENSVAMALAWLNSIQQPDGSWSFQNVGPEARPGTLQSSSAATTLAVLCFLGAGNTTSSGPHAHTVAQAFAFLEKEAVQSSSRKSETLYVSALATIAFSELAALEPTNVRAKSIAATLLAFLQQSQDPIGGGWRYNPGQPGDLSVTGWQIMALQSAKTCGLDVAPATIARSSTFLDSVSSAADSQYSYAPTTEPTRCMSAVGLLSRIYLGSPKNSAFFDAGFRKLTAAGPDPIDIYFNYYASIALHHYGGPLWTEWNSQMRPLLVSQQIRTGPAKGSWALRDPWGTAGGQIYQTCLSTLCLEVYYRYLPMFASDDSPAP